MKEKGSEKTIVLAITMIFIASAFIPAVSLQVESTDSTDGGLCVDDDTTCPNIGANCL